MTLPKTTVEFRSVLAALVILGFFLVCGSTFLLVAMTHNLESWAAGMVGAVVGYWANSVSQVTGFFFGDKQGDKRPPAHPLPPAEEPVPVVPVPPQEIEVDELPATGDASKIYVVKSTGARLRWTGEKYETEGVINARP